jgi:hypothetical protein
MRMVFHARVTSMRQLKILLIDLGMFPDSIPDSSSGRMGDARSFSPHYRPYILLPNCCPDNIKRLLSFIKAAFP